MEKKYFDDDSILYERSRERQRRLRLVITIVPAILGFLILIYKLLTPEVYLPYVYSLVVIMLFGTSGIGGLMVYLQGGTRKIKSSESSSLEYGYEMASLRSEIRNIKAIDENRVRQLEQDFAKLKTALDALDSSSQTMSDEEKVNLFEMIKAKVEAEGVDKITESIRAKLLDSIKKEERFVNVTSYFKDTLTRLRDEVAALSKRGNLNLSIGIITTIAGLGILGYFVMQSTSQNITPAAFAISFVPRLSLVILIEVFAYFFLKLYKASLSEIKYFQNEMTNIESKYISLMVALDQNNAASCSSVIKVLSSTERNHVLEKGQTTVELEKAKMDKEALSSLAKSVSDLIKNKK